MKRVLTGSLVAAVFAVGVSAQTTTPASQPMQSAKDAAKTLTVTGCLKAGDTAESYQLSDLKWKEDKAVGTSGIVAPAAPPVTPGALKLVGTPSTKLSDHVGHTVEVTGTIADKAEKAMGSATPADLAAAAQMSLNVRDLRMIATTCADK